MHNENPLKPYNSERKNYDVKMIIAGVFIFILGVFIGNAGKEAKTVCPTPSPTVSKAELTELKVIDDKLMNSMANVIEYCGTGVTQISNGNFSQLGALTEKVNRQTEVMNKIKEDRKEFIKNNGL